MKLKAVAARLTLRRLMHKGEANDGFIFKKRGSVTILLPKGSTMVEGAHTFC